MNELIKYLSERYFMHSMRSRSRKTALYETDSIGYRYSYDEDPKAASNVRIYPKHLA